MFSDTVKPMGMKLENLPERLREERTRLGMSQSDFGALGGVKKLTQLKYERGMSHPDIGYFLALDGHGIDVGYLLFGKRSPTGRLAALHHLNSRLDDEWVLTVLGEVDIDGLQEAIEDTLPPHAGSPPIAFDPRWIVALIASCPRLADAVDAASALDTKALTSVLVAIEGELSRLGHSLSAEKKSLAAAMLYRVAKGSGRLDPALVQDAIAVAE